MSMRILVVDDASFIRDMVKKQLREKIPGVEVVDAPDGNRAVAHMKAQRIDLILSDWEMPGMSGEELLRWVRSSDTYAKTPFVMVTSRGDRDHVVKAVQAGVSDYITKPFTPEELLKKTFKQLQKIGKKPTQAVTRTGSTQGVAMASVEALTGGRTAESNPVAAKVASDNTLAAETINVLTTGSALQATEKAKVKVATKSKGKAQLRFAASSCPCVIREISLQALSGLVQRSDQLPTVFEAAVVDITSDDGNSVARINGYVHSVAAAEQRQDTNIVKIVVRFVDKDPEKFEFLSRYVAKVN